MALDRLFGQIFEIARSLTSNEPARPSAPPPPMRPMDTTRGVASPGTTGTTGATALDAEPLDTIPPRSFDEDTDEAELVTTTSSARAYEDDEEDENDGLAGEDEIVAVRASEHDLLLSWQLGELPIARGRHLLPEADEIAVKLVVVHRGEGSSVRREERERVVERMGEWLVADVPKDAWVTASVGLRHQGRFVSLVHSPAARAG